MNCQRAFKEQIVRPEIAHCGVQLGIQPVVSFDSHRGMPLEHPINSFDSEELSNGVSTWRHVFAKTVWPGQ